MTTTKKNFFGVYMLYCLNPSYKGRIYIGFTVNPTRRLSQHNKGSSAGGARRTSNRGPWEMRVIVHGFPNKISALAFEWAWQHPDKTRRLKFHRVNKNKLTGFQYRCQVMEALLSVGPWCKFPLSVSWINSECMPIPKITPKHISWDIGSITDINSSPRLFNIKSALSDNQIKRCTGIKIERCSICKKLLSVADKLTCTDETCLLACHIICLAKQFTCSLLPVVGECPLCCRCLLWGDLISKRNSLISSNLL